MSNNDNLARRITPPPPPSQLRVVPPPPPTQNIVDSWEPGGFWVRFVASFIDGIISGVMLIPASVVLNIVLPLQMSGSGPTATPADGFFTALLGRWVIQAGLIFFYYGYFYKTKGATPGKMIFGLRVVDSNTGCNLGYGQTFFREFIGKFLSALTFSIGYLMAGIREDRRALHDLVARTQVIRTK